MTTKYKDDYEQLIEISNNIYNEKNILKNKIDKFDIINYFKKEFLRIINKYKEVLDMKSIFYVIYPNFNLEIFMLLISNKDNKQYFNLNKLTNTQINKLILKFIDFYINFYKDTIIKIFKSNLFNNEKNIFDEYNNNYLNNLFDNKPIQTINICDKLYHCFNSISKKIRNNYLNLIENKDEYIRDYCKDNCDNVYGDDIDIFFNKYYLNFIYDNMDINISRNYLDIELHKFFSSLFWSNFKYNNYNLNKLEDYYFIEKFNEYHNIND